MKNVKNWFHNVSRTEDTLLLVPENQHRSSKAYDVGYRIRTTNNGHTIVLTWSPRGLPESESDPMGESTLQLTLYESKGHIRAGPGNTFNVKVLPLAKPKFRENHLPPRKK